MAQQAPKMCTEKSHDYRAPIMTELGFEGFGHNALKCPPEAHGVPKGGPPVARKQAVERPQNCPKAHLRRCIAVCCCHAWQDVASHRSSQVL